MWSNSKRGFEVCSVLLYSTVRLPEGRGHQRNLGIFLWETFSTKLRDVEQTAVEFKCLGVMGMASVSWFYLFNIQVRANCTTACNIQAALQYVELTHISSSVCFIFFFPVSVSFYKNVHAAWNRFQSHAGPFNLVGGGLRARTEDEQWCWRPGGSVWLVTFTFTETQRRKLRAILPSCFRD